MRGHHLPRSILPAVLQMTSLLTPFLLISFKFSKHVETIEVSISTPDCAQTSVGALGQLWESLSTSSLSATCSTGWVIALYMLSFTLFAHAWNRMPGNHEGKYLTEAANRLLVFFHKPRSSNYTHEEG